MHEKGGLRVQKPILGIQKYHNIEMHTMKGNFQQEDTFYMRKYGPENMTVVLHQHEIMQINYIVRGDCRHFINDQETKVVKGDVLIIPLYVPHKIISADGDDFEIYEIEFTTDYIIQNVSDFESIYSLFDFAYLKPFLMQEDEVHTRYHLSVEQQVAAESVMKNMLDEYVSKRDGYMLMIRGLLLQLLVLLQRAILDSAEESSAQNLENHLSAMGKAVEYVNEHYMDDITLQKVADLTAFSKSYFGMLFKMVTHKTFVEFLNEKRISAAIRLLGDSRMRISDICFECGFNNVSHFNRLFKSEVGLSPSEYRTLTSKKQ